MADNAKKVLEIKNLDIGFKSPRGMVHAIRGVDLILRKGETLAIVGESGSGKSVTMVACNVLADGLRYAFDPKEVA